MKIDFRRYELNKHYYLEDDIDFSSISFSPTYRIRKIKSCHIKLDIIVFSEVADIKVTLSGVVIGACSYTNEDVDVKYSCKENMSFGLTEKSEAEYYEPRLEFDFDPYIISLIDNSVPLNIVKPGAKLPSGGQGYEVLSEDDYNKKKAKTVDSRWAALDDIELD